MLPVEVLHPSKGTDSPAAQRPHGSRLWMRPRNWRREQQLAVNLFGPYDVTQAFLPLLTRSRGAIVNVLSLASLAAVPFSPAYSISKAAAFSLAQSDRKSV